MRFRPLALALTMAFALVSVGFADDQGTSAASGSEDALQGFPATLRTDTPREGFALAIKLSRLGVKATQPDTAVLHELRDDYAHNADSLIAASQVVAIHYQTIAAANGYWQDRR